MLGLGLPRSDRPMASMRELERSLAAVNAEYRRYEPFAVEEMEMGLKPRLRKGLRPALVPDLPALPTIPCEECGGSMPVAKTTGPKRRYCSGKCRQRVSVRNRQAA